MFDLSYAGNCAEHGNPLFNTEGVQISSSRERELQSQVQFLQQSVEKLVEEVQRQKTLNAQLEGKISSLEKSSTTS